MVQDELPAHEGDVVGAGDVARGREAGGVDEGGVVHAQLRRPLVHPGHEGVGTAGQVLGQGHGAVVGRDHAHRLEHILHRELFILLQPDLTAPHGAGVGAGGDQVVVGQSAGVDGLHGQEDGHDLGDAGGLQLLVLVDGVEHFPGGLLHQEAGLALHRKLRRSRRGRGYREYHQRQQDCEKSFHNPVRSFPF